MYPTSRPTRRHLLKAALAGAAGVALGAPAIRLAAQAGQSPVIVKLSDDLFVVTLPGEANVIAQTGADGVLLVDGASAGAHAKLLETVAALPRGGAVHTLFNTHWHPEQTGANAFLGGAGKTIIAQENTRLWLAT